jgi:hypothetical protein
MPTITKVVVGRPTEPLKGAPEDYFRVDFREFPKLREWTLQRPEGSTQPVVGDLLLLREGDLRVATLEVIEPKEEDIARFGERAVRVRQIQETLSDLTIGVPYTPWQGKSKEGIQADLAELEAAGELLASKQR